MKNYILISLIFIGTTTFAQSSIQPKFEVEGSVISATYFHDNGAIQQQGTFNKKGKLDGLWISYNDNGVKLSQGNYDKGIKTGKWFFWTENSLKEVDYNDSRITNVNEWNIKSELATTLK
jgi:antitoxin component YwqK of YwqJK toxin-antitoxin module